MVAICRTPGVDPRSAGRDRNLGPSSPEGPSPTTRLCRVAAGRCAVAASSFSPTAYCPRGWTRSGGRSVATVSTWLRPCHKSGEFSWGVGDVLTPLKCSVIRSCYPFHAKSDIVAYLFVASSNDLGNCDYKVSNSRLSSEMNSRGSETKRLRHSFRCLSGGTEETKGNSVMPAPGPKFETEPFRMKGTSACYPIDRDRTTEIPWFGNCVFGMGEKRLSVTRQLLMH